MSTHISSGADEVLTSAAESGPVDPLDALLGQIVGGYFVLTDGQGSVSKWSEPAELLFGRPAQEILGQSFFGTLLDPAARGRRAVLEVVPGERRPAELPGPRVRRRRPRRGPPLPDRGRLRPRQARRGLRLLAVPRGPRLRAAAEPDAAAHAPAAPGRRARARQGDRGRDAALGGLAHGRHARRLPPDRADPVGRRGARRPRGRARRAGRRRRGAPDHPRPGRPGLHRPRPRRRGRRGGAPAVGDGAHRRPRADGRRRCPRRSRRRAATSTPAAPAPRPPSARRPACAPTSSAPSPRSSRAATTRRTWTCSRAWTASSAPASTRTPPAPPP